MIAAATSGVFALRSLARGNERFTRHLTPGQRRAIFLCTIAGLNLAALSALGANFARLLFTVP